MRISANRRVRTLSGTAIAAVPLVIALGGCDPCAGTNVCAASTRVDLIGQIVDPTNGVPVQGATVQVNFPDGSTAGATTDAKGSWEASRTVHSTEPLTASVVVTAPGHPGYTIPGLSVTPVTRRGDATVFDPWYAYPYAQYQATLVQNGTPLTYAQVSFKPTGGVPVTDARSLTDTTNGAGVFALALGGDQLGQVFGTLTVTGTGLAQPTVVDGYPVSLDYRYRIPGPQAVYDVNPLLTYGGQIYFRGTGRPAQGVRVTWVRTGGIQTDSATYTTTSDATGFFIFRLTPLSTGQVTGTITFTPPSGEGSTYRNITMSTYDSTTYRSLGGFSFGQRWAYGISIFRNDRNEPAAGVPVTFRRTGGIAMQPDSIQAVADSANGWLALKASVTDTGVLEGEITVYPDSGPPRVITGLKLHTYASDTMRFGGVYSFGPSLHYAGRLMDTDSVGVANAQVVWTRDFGLDATPPTLTETTDSLGYFDFWLYPPYNTEGTVSGHLTVTPGAPYASGSQYVINWVSLTTFDGLERRFSYVFLIPKP